MAETDPAWSVPSSSSRSFAQTSNDTPNFSLHPQLESSEQGQTSYSCRDSIIFVAVVAFGSIPFLKTILLPSSFTVFSALRCFYPRYLALLGKVGLFLHQCSPLVMVPGAPPSVFHLLFQQSPSTRQPSVKVWSNYL